MEYNVHTYVNEFSKWVLYAQLYVNTFKIFNSLYLNLLYLKNAWSCLYAFLHQSTVIQDHSMDGLFNG